MKWHELHRARMAARTLAKHRERVARERVMDTTLLLARQLGKPELVAKVEEARGLR